MKKTLLYGTAVSALLLTGWSLNVSAQTADTTSTTSTDATTAGSQSDTSIPEVIITATRKKTSLQRTAASVDAIQGSELAAKGSVRFDDVLKDVPAVVIQGQSRGFTPAIRGLGSDLPPGSGEGSVAVSFDGAYNIRSESGAAGFYDLSRVEVLRGPQGTLYGRNATAGVVNVITNNPELGSTSGDIGIEVGNYGLIRKMAAVNLPIGEDFALRIAGQTVDRDGYLSNGEDDDVTRALRVKALYKPNDTFSALLGLDYVNVGGKGAGGVLSYAGDDAPSDPWYTSDTVAGFFGPIDTRQTGRNYNQYKLWTDLNFDLGFANLTVTPAYTTAGDREYGCFTTNCNADASDPKSIKQFSNEIRLTSRPSSKIEWAIGYYHYDYKSVTFTNAVNPVPEVNTTTAAAHTDAIFGQVTVPVTKDFRLTAGIRQTRDYKSKDVVDSFTGPGRGSHVWTHPDYKLAAEYDLSPVSMLYASISTGYRPGGFNPDFTEFKPEKLTSYEVGSKNRFFGNRLIVNASLYDYDYQDYQAFNFVVVPVPQFEFYNTKITNYGGELEVTGRVSSNDTLSFTASHLFTRFDEDLFVGLPIPVNLKGYEIPHAPKWTLNGNYEHRFDLSNGAVISLSGHVRYVDEQYVGPDESNAGAVQPAFTIGDLFATYIMPDGRWTLGAYVKNVGDTPVKTNYINGYNTLAAPRTFGIVLTGKFGD